MIVEFNVVKVVIVGPISIVCNSLAPTIIRLDILCPTIKSESVSDNLAGRWSPGPGPVGGCRARKIRLRGKKIFDLKTVEYEEIIEF